MEQMLLILSFLLIIFLSKLSLHKYRYKKNLPPSPPLIPIIGHLHLAKQPIHRTFHHLSEKYGPIFSLKFGNRSVVVISSPSAVEECFKKNDIVFANRPLLLAAKYLHYNNTTIAAAPYGPLWKSLHRIAKLDIFSTNRLQICENTRKDEIESLVKDLYDHEDHHDNKSVEKFVTVEMKSRVSELSMNIITRMVFGKRFSGAKVKNEKWGEEFKSIVKEMIELHQLNPEDFLPFLRFINFKKMEKRMLDLQVKTDHFLQDLIDKHRNRNGFRSSSSSTHPEGKWTLLLDGLLSMQQMEPQNYSDEIIKGIILIMISAGTDTTSVTIEWAMSLLINHPDVLNKAEDELQNIIGNDRLMEETDIPKLPYLQGIINETLRLFPAAPTLVPHESSADCTIQDFHVPCKTMLLTNAWAIHRDPKLWEDPESFKPERFLDQQVKDALKFKLIPFGYGRRSCPGAGLANRVMALTLGTLIQCFEWERINKDEFVDMSEGIGITMQKVKPLVAKCRPRKKMVKILERL